MLNTWQSLQPSSTTLDLGVFQLRWYSLIVTGAIIVAYFLARKYYRQDYGNDKLFDSNIFWIIIAGLIGARLFHVFIFQWAYYSQHLSEIIRIWEGGIAIQGAVVFGFLALWLLSLKRQFNLWQWTDYLAPALALGQAIGRWGNYFNQELYGLPSTLPWAIYISPELRIKNFELQSLFHPVFLYESLLNLALFIILVSLRQKLKVGQLSGLYLIGYGCIRFIVEFIKIDYQPEFFGLRLAQYLALLFVVLGFLIFSYFNKIKQSTVN